jgi:hypothetical protein
MRHTHCHSCLVSSHLPLNNHRCCTLLVLHVISRYGPEHNVASLEALLTDYGREAIESIEHASSTKSKKKSLSSEAVLDADEVALDGPSEPCLTSAVLDQQPSRREKKTPKGGQQPSTHEKKTSDDVPGYNKMPKGWDKFKAMVDKFISEPIECFAKSAPCSHKGHTTCEIPHVRDALNNILQGGNLPGHMTRRFNRILLNCAGTCCFDWSSIGSKKQLEGPSAKLCAIWLAHRLLIREDLIIHENVVGFDVRTLTFFLDKYYSVIAVIENPTHQGIPAKRPRRLTAFVRKEHVIL